MLHSCSDTEDNSGNLHFIFFFWSSFSPVAHNISCAAFRIAERGHIEKAMYSGWYSVQDETFVKESQIEERTDGDGNVVARVSAESGHVLEWTEEENYVFKLSR